MRDQASLNTTVVKWEDKEERLCVFIADGIVTLDAGEAQTQAMLAGTLIARSVASPVVRAIMKVAARAPEALIQFRTILLSPDGLDETALRSLADIAPEVRLISDERLLNANEQLVLGPSRSWIGDCMRRDPSVRDSYESFAADCDAMSKRSTSAFQKLWQFAKPLPPQSRTTGSAGLSSPSDTPVGPIDAAAMLEPGQTVIASTRH
jgi:hypothetical protein